MPTADPVKVIGLEVDGRHAVIQPPADAARSLVLATLSVLRATTVTGSTLAHVIGRWTWWMMLRRPTLALLQHTYSYIRVAQRRPFTLWHSVRRELYNLLAVLPLLSYQLDSQFFHRAVASDASDLAGGVVAAPLTADLLRSLWSLCADRHHAVTQARYNAHGADDSGSSVRVSLRTGPSFVSAATVDAFYDTVRAAPWRVCISTAWRTDEHINVLELRAALLALHWCLSSPTCVGRRVLLLVDSTVAFFSLWKGRSSSPALLLVLRKLSALLLCSGLSLLPGWVPSAVNPADAPSRLLPLVPAAAAIVPAAVAPVSLTGPPPTPARADCPTSGRLIG